MIKDRIVVVGVSAVGKSTFARALTDKTGLPLVQMDALMWKPGWEYVGGAATAEAIQEYAQAAQWVIEGYITQAAQADLFTRADMVIYLDYPGHVSAWRYIKRCWKHGTDPRPELPLSPDRFSLKTLHLVWSKKEAQNLESILSEDTEIAEKTIRICRPEEADKFLEAV